jgi:prepilin-type N-terminal cleavage/methylation domain-containing protein
MLSPVLSNLARPLLKYGRAFTLVELLVVVLVVAILIGVALPSLLGETGKAQDSAAQQNVATATDEADAYYATNGQFSTASSLALAINGGEPSLSVRDNLNGSTFSNGPSDITVAVNSSTMATLCDQSSSGRFFCEQGNRAGASTFSTAASEASARCALPVQPSGGCSNSTGGVSGWTSTVSASAGATPSRDGFMFYSDTDNGAVLAADGNRMSVVAPEWFSVSPTANTVYSGSSSPCTTAPTGYSTVMAASATQGFQVWPVLNLNWGSSTGTTAPSGNAVLLDNSSDVTSIINGIVSCAKTWQSTGANFGGYTLDMEGMWASNSNGSGVSGAYSQSAQTTAFVQQLAGDLHNLGLKLAVYSPRRTTSSDVETNYTPRSYSWPALSQAADLLVVSGYDEHGPTAGAGAITTNAGWQAMVAYAKSVASGNIVPVAGAYGYDWPAASGSAASSVNGSQVQSPATLTALAASSSATITTDPSSSESTFTYGPDVVYFENAQSLAARVSAAKASGLGWWGLFPAQDAPTSFWSLVP